MADKDLHTKVLGIKALNTTTITANGTTNGTILDLQGFDSVEFAFLSGGSIGADLSVTMEHDDVIGFGTATSVGSDFIIGTLPTYTISGAAINTVKGVGYVGKKRFVRINVVAANWASNTVISCIAIKGDARVEKTQ